MSAIDGPYISHRLKAPARLRVAVFTGDFYPEQVGGQGIYAFEVATRAAALGCDIRVVCPMTPARVAYTYPEHVRVELVRAKPDPVSYNRALWPIQRRVMAEADVLHVNELFGMSVSLLASKPTALVVSSHNAYLDRFHAAHGAKKLMYLPLIALERLSYPRAQRLIIGSEIEREPVRQLGVPDARILTIPYGVEAARFADPTGEQRRATRARLGIPESAQVALFVGRCVERKKPHVVAEAFRALAAENPNFHGILLGDGDLLPRVRELCGTEPRLHLLGAISFADLPQYYAAADVFTLPTVREGSISLAVLEAAAAGLPLVLTDDSCGQSAVFEPGRNGERVALGDPLDLAAGLRAAFARRVEYGARSAQLVEQHFSWDACAKQTVTCYETALRERAG